MLNHWIGEEDEENGIKLLLKTSELKKVKTSKFTAFIGNHKIFGRFLVFDEGKRKTIQICENFDFYSEMFHVPMCAHPNPQYVLIIGGGDGSTLREILKHNPQKVVLCEIDKDVVNVGLHYLQTYKNALQNERVQFVFMDGATYVKETNEKFDVIICDVTDIYPGEPAGSLGTSQFLENVKKILRNNGIFCIQSGSPIFHKDIVRHLYSLAKKTFKYSFVYASVVPFYPGGIWTFIICSDNLDPRIPRRTFIGKFYSPEIHKIVFVLPPFLKRLLENQ